MAKKKSKFGANVAQLASKRKKEARSFGYLNLPKDVQIFKEHKTPGKSRIKLDIIPYIVTDEHHPDRDDDLQTAQPGEPWYRRPVAAHRGIGVNNESIICPAATQGKKCPVCEFRKKQFKEDVDKDEIVGRASERSLYLVIPRDHKDYEEEIHIWDISDYLFHDKLVDELEEDPERGCFFNLEDGLTLSMKFTEKSIGSNSFAEVNKIEFVERDEEYDDSILEDAPKLDDLIKILSYQEIKAKFYEEDDEDEEEEPEEIEDDDDEDEEEVPRSEERPKKRTTKKLKKEEPEEIEDDEDEEDEPKNKRRSKKETKKKTEEDPECPGGGTFGEDWDELEECEECELYQACGERQEELEKNK